MSAVSKHLSVMDVGGNQIHDTQETRALNLSLSCFGDACFGDALIMLDLKADGSAALLAAIVESSDDAIISKTLEGIITSWNRGSQNLFGYTAGEAIGQHITLIIPVERHSEEDDILARLRRGEKIDHFETVRQTKDGRRLEISLTVSPIRDSQGQIIGASKVARDITERKRADETRERLAAIVESSDDAIIGKTLEGIVTSWNRGAAESFRLYRRRSDRSAHNLDYSCRTPRGRRRYSGAPAARRKNRSL